MNLRDERGITIIELLVVMLLTGILMVGIVDIFVSGGRAGADANARMDAQQNARVALDQIENQGRCATTAALLNSGAGVAFTLPAECTHGTGAVSWCVVSGVLERYAANGCTGTGVSYVRSITTPTPFTIVANSGDLPQLLISLTSDENAHSGDGSTLQDTITLRNAADS